MTRSERRGRRAFLLGGVPLVAGAVLLVFGLLYEGDGSRLMFFAPAILLLTLGAWILGSGLLAAPPTPPRAPARRASRPGPYIPSVAHARSTEGRGRWAFLLGGVPLVAGVVLLVFGLLYDGDGSRLMFFAPAILLLTLGAWILGNGWLAVRATRPGRGEARGRPRGR